MAVTAQELLTAINGAGQGLGHVFPGAPAMDAQDRRSVDAESFADRPRCLSARQRRANDRDERLGKLGVPTRGSPRGLFWGGPDGAAFVATLTGHVPVVVGNGAEPEVGGIATRRIVTRVKDTRRTPVFAGRDSSMGKRERNAVRLLRPVRPAPESHLSVSLPVPACDPGPASIWASGAVNLRPESLGSGGGDKIRVKHRYLLTGGARRVTSTAAPFLWTSIIASTKGEMTWR